jgi:UDP-3-O-acyl-N-acetylglucosamine deacetylase
MCNKELLRYSDEFIRCKTFDLVGDVCHLAGKPMKTKIVVEEPEH